MLKKLKEYIRQEKKGMLQAFIALVIVVIAFLAYLYLVGVPMTKADNLYNTGYLYFTENNYPEAKKALQSSLDSFYTQEAYDLFQKVK